MKVYIREYLREIPIIDQLYRMIVSYGKLYPEDNSDSYDDYRYYLSSDNVLRFLDYVLPGDTEYYTRNLGESDENFINRLKNTDDFARRFEKEFTEDAESWVEDLIQTRKDYLTYLRQLFYSVKGTYKVLDFILDYDLFQTSIGQDLQTPDTVTKITYSARNIEIIIESLPEIFDRDVFCDYLEKFLCSLLYFESLKITINGTKITVSDNTTISLNHGEIFFKYYEAGRPVEEDEDAEEEENPEVPNEPGDDDNEGEGGDNSGEEGGEDEGDDDITPEESEENDSEGENNDNMEENEDENVSPSESEENDSEGGNNNDNTEGGEENNGTGDD